MPAQRQQYETQLISDPDVELIAFSFQTNDTNPPTLPRGRVVSGTPSRTSEGLYSVQLKHPYPRQIVAQFVQLDLAAFPASARANAGSVDTAAYNKDTGVVTIRFYTSSVPAAAGDLADPTSGVRASVFLYCQMRETNVQS